MSDHEENPFTEENPFDDPSIQQITENSKTQVQVQDYNPFKNLQSVYNSDKNQPAVMELIQDTTQQNQSQAMMKELQRKQEELDRRQQELARREEEILQRNYNTRHNNWPPLPDQCCFQPCFYQDIEVDIPLEFQLIVRQLYHLWIFHGLILMLNILGGIIVTDFTIIIVGIFYAIVFIPFSYLCWFRPAYKAFRFDSSFNFMIFFFMFFVQIIITATQALGMSKGGTMGIITAVRKLKESDTPAGVVSAIVELTIAGGFCCATVADLLVISKVHRVYRSTGASIAKAQSEFSSEFARNQHVRRAASNIAAAAVQTQVNPSGSTKR